MDSYEAEQGIKNETHLTLLAIFHFVLAGLSTLGLLFIGFHFLMMNTVFNNPQFMSQMQAQMARQPQPMPFNPQTFFHAFLWFYVAMGTWSAVSLVVNIIAGICLMSRRARTFCVGVGGFNCLNIPLGTVLGIFTIIVLVRPSVRVRFESPGANPLAGR